MVYDPPTNLLFALAERTGAEHVLVRTDATSGQVREQRPAEPPRGDWNPTVMGLNEFSAPTTTTESRGGGGPKSLRRRSDASSEAVPMSTRGSSGGDAR
jgi:hypothetical protein